MAISFNNLRNLNDTGLNPTCYRVTSGGTVFTSISVSTGKLFPDTGMVVDDYVIWKQNYQCFKPRGLRFHVGTAFTAVGLTGVWEYRKSDSTWAAFSGVTDGTNSFQTAGTNLDVTWTVPTDWGTNATTVNAISGALWWRFRVTAVTSYTVGPLLGGTTPAVTQEYDNAVRVNANHVYDSGTATAGATQTLTDSGKGWTVDALRWRHVYIHTGTGAGQVRVIKSNTATAISIYHFWDTNPSTDSQYVITANFEDLYQADVSGGWGVITKAGQHCYSFNAFLDIQAAAFGDCNAMVEFQNDYMFYVSQAPTNTYQLHFGWRLPNAYGLDKGVWGNTIVSNRTTSVDERGSGFYFGGSVTGSEYAFSAGNKYILRFDETYTAATGFIRHWFNFFGRYSINDYFEGWRSVIFPKTGGSGRSEVRNLVVSFGYSGIEQPMANFDGVKSYYNAGLALFITAASNYTFPNFNLGLNNYDQSSTIYTSLLSYFGYQGTTTKYINMKPRVRPMTDVFSTVSTGRSQPQVSIRALVTDEYGNPVQNATMRISDSLNRNNFNVLNFDAVDDIVTIPNAATANQFLGSTAFSVEAWVLTRSAGESAAGRIVDKSALGTTGYLLFNNNGVIVFRVLTSSGTFSSANAGYFNSSFYHFVGTFDGSNIRIYANGSVVGSPVAVTGSIQDDSAVPLCIGNESGTSRTYDGFIRRVRIFKNKALSSTDVQALYNSANFTQNEPSPISGCTGEYNFTDGSGATVTDSSGNGNNGTIGGSATWYSSNTGLSTQSYTLTSGAVAEFLNAQTVTSGGSYSLSAQPASATRLRFTISNFVDNATGGGNNARIIVTGTDANSNAVTEVVWLEEFGNGSYWTENEFLTVIASGLATTGWTGTVTVDRAGLFYPQNVDIESWCAPNDVNLLVANFNPFYIRISAPGYETVTIKKELAEAQNLHIPLKRAELHLCHLM